MELLELFFSFLKIGFTSFGGLSMIPVINNEMLAHGWMTQAEVIDIIAIAEMTPGPIGLNCATFAGMRMAGLAGALIANLGVLTPTLTLTFLAAVCFERFRESRGLRGVLYGVRPVCFGLLTATFVSLCGSNFFPAGAFSWQSVLIAAVGALCMWKLRFSVPKVILLSAAMGLILVR